MKDAAVVPNGCERLASVLERYLIKRRTNVIEVFPLKANLQIMVVQDCVVELLKKLGTFFRVQFVDEFGEVADPEDAFPPAGMSVAVSPQVSWRKLTL